MEKKGQPHDGRDAPGANNIPDAPHSRDGEPIRPPENALADLPHLNDGQPATGELPHRQRSRRLSEASAAARAMRMERRRSRGSSAIEYDAPQNYGNLDELATSPVQNPDESAVYRHQSLEDTRSREQDYARQQGRQGRPGSPDHQKPPSASQVSTVVTQIYTISYLILFSILGTLARLGLQALTTYSGSPVTFSSAWYNFAGSFIMGFLAEDRMLFRLDSDTSIRSRNKEKSNDEEQSSGNSDPPQAQEPQAAAKQAHLAYKKTVPLYIGLATGFCGSFTSFSSFLRDAFLSLANDPLSTATANPTIPRNGGYSFLALLAVLITTITLSLSALFIGAHAAIALEPFTPSLPRKMSPPRSLIDRLAVFLAVGTWLGAIFLTIFPPDRYITAPETERYRPVTVALCFAPLGCLARFYLALLLNARLPSFPLGTFAANILGTTVLAVAWDLAHVDAGGVAGCLVLRGVEDGFCGCLTTVSTWVAELAALRRAHAYRYGTASVGVGLGIMVAIMGGLRWGRGYDEMVCGR